MKYTDLLGREWDDMHCGEVVVEGLKRLGMEVAALYVPADQQAAVRLVVSLERGEGVGDWVLVATPDMKHCACEGDVVVSDGPAGHDDQYHVSLMISQTLAITSSRAHGVHCRPLRGISGMRGIYRWIPGTASPARGVMP